MLGYALNALRILLLILALHHMYRKRRRKKGITWIPELRNHLRYSALNSVSFALVYPILLYLDLSQSGASLALLDILVITLVEMSILIPPLNAISREGIWIEGRFFPRKHYLKHEMRDGKILLEYRVWKFRSQIVFTMPEKAKKILDGFSE